MSSGIPKQTATTVASVLDRLTKIIRERVPGDPQLHASLERLRLELPKRVEANCEQLIEETRAATEQEYAQRAASQAEVRRQEEEAAAVVKAQRSKFLLRILVACFSDLLHGRSKHLGVDRAFILGLDSYLDKFLGGVVYEDLNLSAKDIVERFDDEDDKVMWETLIGNHHSHRFILDILGRIILRFGDFERSKRTFITIVNNANMDANVPEFGEREFNLIFQRLFSTLFTFIDKGVNAEIILDFRLGDGAFEKIRKIRRQSLQGGALQWEG